MRIVSAAEAVAGIRSGQQIFIHAGAATPSVLLNALVARAPELEDVRILSLHTEGPDPQLAPGLAGHFRHRALFIGPMARQAVNEGRAEYIPVFLSDVPKLLGDGHLPLDAVIVNVTPPDEHGYCSLGTTVEAAKAAVRAATTVIAQLNRAMPRTLGESFVHESEIDLGVEVDVPPYQVPSPKVGPVERTIAEYVADLIPDGSVLQMGIGAIPAAVGEALRDKRDLGVHSEMITDVVADLIEAGVITGARKEIDQGRSVQAILLGTKRLYDYAHDNPMFEMRPIDYTNDTHVIRQLRRMTAVNSAIEIDLTGQVVADSIGWRLYSGVGGQMDFMRGAALAPEGRPIIAMPSATSDGTKSRIVTALHPGSGVVTTRAHVRTVVTEYGVAELYGKSLAERARALIAIAHPAFREVLERQAREHPVLFPGGLPLPVAPDRRAPS